jgi:adenylate kinase family enzyme
MTAVRYAILGNSGSGKSTLAKRLAAKHGLPVLDLDTIYWEPAHVTTERPAAAREADLDRFLAASEGWIVEGCYADLIGRSLRLRPTLLFLNLPVSTCLDHARLRPHEPHKFATAEEQDRLLEPLLHWIADYPRRDGTLSYAAHRALFDGYAGPRREFTAAADVTTYLNN